MLAAAASLLVANCAGRMIEQGMRSYAGQPISAVIAKLGFPTSEQVIAGAKVYVWSTVSFVDGSSFQCRIRAIVDAQEIISSWDYEGNEYGCANYARRLSR